MTGTTDKPVVFLAFANDRDDNVGYLRNLPDEARRLREVIETAVAAGLCEVVVRTNSTAGDIFKVFQDARYRNRVAIFHYGGHANGYQLLLESAAGEVAAADAGGLAAFMGWHGPTLTDSGGYQVFSLAPLRRVSDEGVSFRSHIDGSQHNLTPELAMQYQEALGADIIMALDECPAHDDSLDKVKRATERTHRWAERCLKAHKRPGQALYAIVQGGLFPELRRQSAEYLVSLDFPGYAIGGLSIGEPKKVTMTMVEATAALLPGGKPRYLMGVGKPEDIVEAVRVGVDMFDCVLPTRNARNGVLFTSFGKISIKQARYIEDEMPIDPDCSCSVCRSYSRAYLRHLYQSNEILASVLNTTHNLYYYLHLMQGMRQAIEQNRFTAFRREFYRKRLPTGDA